jgi:hypothetical protein
MSSSQDYEQSDPDAYGIDEWGGRDGNPGDELEALIEEIDRPFASLSFGTTALEQEEGASLDERLKEELRSTRPAHRQFAIEYFDAPDYEDQLVATGSFEHDPFVSPEEAAMTVRDRVPGAVDHPVAPGTEWNQLDPPEPEDPTE